MTPEQEARIRALADELSEVRGGSVHFRAQEAKRYGKDLAALLAEVDRLRGAIRKAHRISIRHDHEITRLVDLQDHLEAALSTEPRGESNG